MEKLLSSVSVSKLLVGCFILGQSTSRLPCNGVNESTSCCGPALQTTYKPNSKKCSLWCGLAVVKSEVDTHE